MTRKVITRDELDAFLRKHNLWLQNDPAGERADLTGANNLNYPITCPEKGSFTAFKRAENHIIELLVPEDALRSSAFSRKCRCSKAIVVSITNLDGSITEATSVHSSYDIDFVYSVGETVSVDNFDPNRWNECAPGIHFFITRDEAVNYRF